MTLRILCFKSNDKYPDAKYRHRTFSQLKPNSSCGGLSYRDVMVGYRIGMLWWAIISECYGRLSRRNVMVGYRIGMLWRAIASECYGGLSYRNVMVGYHIGMLW
jgi:hypothetical protein